MSERDAQETIEAAMEGGVRFFDNAEGYEDGKSESKYGKYLTPKYRDEIFLMTKTEQKSKEEAVKSLEASLKKIKHRISGFVAGSYSGVCYRRGRTCARRYHRCYARGKGIR